MLDGADRAGADGDLGLSVQDRLGQGGDAIGPVLVVAIGVHDHIGTMAQTGLDPGHERLCQTLIMAERHHMVDAMFARRFDGRVGRAVIDDQPLNRVKTIDLPRQVSKRLGQLLPPR